MAVQVFVDDSGTDLQESPAVLAGVLARAEDWLAFSDAWEAALQEPPSIRRFKMSEAAKLGGPFGYFTQEQRDDKLRRLAAVVSVLRPTVFRTSIDLPGFEAAVGPVLTPPLNQPYFHLNYAMVWRVAFQMAICHQIDPFEIIFDRQVMHEQGVGLWYAPFCDLVKRLGDAEGPSSIWVPARALLPDQPLFRSDDQFVPLQCADLYAYLLRAELLGRGTEYAWLRALMPPVSSAADLSTDYWRTLISVPKTGLVQRLDPDRYADLLGLNAPPSQIPRLLQPRARAVRASRARTSPAPTQSLGPEQPRESS